MYINICVLFEKEFQSDSLSMREDGRAFFSAFPSMLCFSVSSQFD